MKPGIGNGDSGIAVRLIAIPVWISGQPVSGSPNPRKATTRHGLHDYRFPIPDSRM